MGLMGLIDDRTATQRGGVVRYVRYERWILRGILYFIMLGCSGLFGITLFFSGEYFYYFRMGLGFPFMMALVGLACSLPRDG